MTPNLRIVPDCNRALPSWSVRIRELRESCGMTQERAALHWGVDPRTIRNWEAGVGDGRMLAGCLALEMKTRAA